MQITARSACAYLRAERNRADGLFTRLTVRNSQHGCVYPREARRRVLINLVRSRPPRWWRKGAQQRRWRGRRRRRRRRPRRRRRRRRWRRKKGEEGGERKERTALAAHEGRENRSFPSFALLHRVRTLRPCFYRNYSPRSFLSFFLSFFLFLQARTQLCAQSRWFGGWGRNTNSRDFKYFTIRTKIRKRRILDNFSLSNTNIVI